jgi:hypothetical protein
MNYPTLLDIMTNGSNPIQDTKTYPKLNPSKTWNYFAQIKKHINKYWETCTRSYGLFIEGNPEEILEYLKKCYEIYNTHAETRKTEPSGFHYFINTNFNRSGIIYYANKSKTKQLMEGDIIGYTFRPEAVIG